MTSTRLPPRDQVITEPPRSVRRATTIMYILIGLALLSPLAFVGLAVQPLVQGGSPASLDAERMSILPAAIAVIVAGLLWLVVTRKARLGRRWAWITLLVVLGLLALMGFGVLSTGASNAVGVGAVMTLVPLVLMVMLAGPRRARAYYARRRYDRF